MMPDKMVVIRLVGITLCQQIGIPSSTVSSLPIQTSMHFEHPCSYILMEDVKVMETT